MILNRSKRTRSRCSGFFIILIFFIPTFLFGHPPDTNAMDGGTSAPASIESIAPVAGIHLPFHSSPPVLFFYHVRDGRIRQSSFNLAELDATSPVPIDGYVAGILVFCESEMSILVGRQKLQKLEEDADGSLYFDYFGRLNPKKFWKPDIATAGILYDAQRSGDKNSSFETYALFPETILDTISTQNQFDILFRQADRSFKVTVCHSGYLDLPASNVLSGHYEANPAFRYLGNRMDAIKEAPNFSEKVAAIAEGVALVERTFGLKLVDHVNLIDCESIENAITRVGRNDIWFFINTFRDESISELRTIATHEALHLLVDQYRFVGSYNIRELFADLKGYDEFSAERFFLITRGTVNKDSCSRDGSHRFFEFINEKNFFDRKGGHSQDNLDEFCTSFLHTLLFVSQLPKNLLSPLVTQDSIATGRLTSREIHEFLNIYLRSIRIFHEIVFRHDSGNMAKFFFRQKRDYIQHLISSENLSASFPTVP